MIKFHNTLGGEKEEFKPIEAGKVGVYACGPTVYDFAHIGNLRSYIFADILRRTLEYNGYEVKQVMNITDVGHLVSDGDEGEDKMTKALKRESKPLTLEAMKEVADFYAEKFKEDIADLNIETPHVFPKASEHIKEMIEIIKALEEKGFAYKTSGGVYFEVSKFKDYGKLGKINVKGLEEGARIEKNPEKRGGADFALWKFNANLGWDSPWGKGFPGWHIECSAMSVKYLGQPFDIHTGGVDHIPVHHQNEIAQSEAAYGKPLANYWLHGEFLVLSEKKMAKSAGTFITLRDLKEKGFNPLAYRFLVLGAHYRTPLNFSWEALEAARNGLEHLYDKISNLKSQISNLGNINEEYKNKFLEKINDDLNTPRALAVVQELLKSDVSAGDKLATLFDFDRVLGLGLKDSSRTEEIPEEIKKLAEEREAARREKDWQKSDELRERIRSLGYEIEDTDKGHTLKKK